MLGSLCYLLLQGLISNGIRKLTNNLKQIQLSPSTYQPECLNLIATLQPETSNNFIGLLLQFNHFDTWLQVPEMEDQCQAHMANTDMKRNYIKFAKHRLSIGDTASAISTLESCKRDNWPEIYRLK